MGLALIALANTRAYEGLVLTVPVGITLAAWLLLAHRPGIRARLLRVALPLGIVLVLAGIATGYYFWRVTANPFRMPYQVARATYATPPRYSSGRPPGPSPSITTR